MAKMAQKTRPMTTERVVTSCTCSSGTTGT
jgi:hypothetical protein